METMPVNKISQLLVDLDAEMVRIYDEYIKSHEEFNAYRGKSLDTQEMVDDVNRILKNIQEKWAQLYPAYHFIVYRHQMAVNATSEFNRFIEDMKKSGAKQEGKE